MSRENSPNYALGAADALADMARVAEHGGVAVGPDVSQLRNPNYPAMYLKGYRENYEPVPHLCGITCPYNDKGPFGRWSGGVAANRAGRAS